MSNKMNFLSHFSRMPISRRVPLLAIGILAMVLALISLLMSTVAEKGSRDRIVLWVGDKTQSIANSIDAFDATARLMTDRAYKPFRKKFAENFELDAEGGQLKSWGCCSMGIPPKWMLSTWPMGVLPPSSCARETTSSASPLR